MPRTTDSAVATASESLEAAAFSFADLPAELTAALAEVGITDPTPVQAAVIPDALSGGDVLGRAQTGSGKTLAFGIPILSRLAGRRSRPCHPRALVVVPTRELATQVAGAMAPLAQSLSLRLTTVYGGTPYERQQRQLRQRADIVVATPGRLEDLNENGWVFFDDIEMTVLDEADHLCDLGFYPVVDKLVGLTPAGSQRLLLSATLDGDVDRLVRSHLRDPQVHELDPSAGAVTTMAHHTLLVGGFRDKIEATRRLVAANGRSIVFTRTREGAVTLAEALSDSGVAAVDLHGNLSQRVRERNLARFSRGDAQAVVATDVAARGIHVDEVSLVVHFDHAADAKAYLHRSGRTARAGADGCVVTLTAPRTLDQVVRLQRDAAVEVRHHDLRSAPESLTAQALGESGSATPVGSQRGRSAGQGKRHPGKGRPGKQQHGRSSYGGKRSPHARHRGPADGARNGTSRSRRGDATGGRAERRA